MTWQMPITGNYFLTAGKLLLLESAISFTLILNNSCAVFKTETNYNHYQSFKIHHIHICLLHLYMIERDNQNLFNTYTFKTHKNKCKTFFNIKREVTPKFFPYSFGQYCTHT